MSTGWQREGDRGVSGDRDTGPPSSTLTAFTTRPGASAASDSARKGPLSSRGGSSGRRPLRGERQRPGRTRGWKYRRAWLWKTLIYRAGVTQFSSSNEKPVLLPFTPLRAPSSANPGAARGLVRTRPSRARGPFSRVGPTPVTFPLCDLVIFLCLLLEKSLLK